MKPTTSHYGLSLTKRLFDVSIGSLVLLIVIAISPFIFVAIKCSSRGPIFFQQPRIGLNGRLFSMIKFRTLKTISHSHHESGLCPPHSSRNTLVGTLMRKLHLDEFPQCINVIKGDMSVVGPRPYIEEECVTLNKTYPEFAYRHNVKPGITGLAQLAYDHENDESSTLEKLRHDLEYIQTCSFKKDVVIVVKTLYESIRLRGI
tara:strand:+ start:748 stop:1356 length:609 start_codon:yes stop_codon:yes gene_type:complete